MDQSWVITPMRPADHEQVISVQHAAFAAVAAQYQDPDLPPLAENVSDLSSWLGQGRFGWAAREGCLVIASIRGELIGTDLYLSRLSVSPDHQGRGIASALLCRAEQVPGAATSRLSTGHRSDQALAMYYRAGYRKEFQEVVNSQVTLVHLVKKLTVTD